MLQRISGGQTNSVRLGRTARPRTRRGCVNTSCPQQDYFPTTHWSVISNAGNSQSPRTESALAQLCRCYWEPLYVYACHGGTAQKADAEDLVQSFFSSHFLKTNFLQDLNSKKGRFRAY